MAKRTQGYSYREEMRTTSRACDYVVLPREAYERLAREPWSVVMAEVQANGYRAASGTVMNLPKGIRPASGEALVYEGENGLLHLCEQGW